MATLHLMVGLPCSGKTTKAKILEKKYNAIVLTLDKWHIKLFGNDTMEKTHDIRHKIIEEMMLEIAERLLILGTNVILDFGFWGKKERMYLRNKAKEIGVNFKIHFMDVPKEELNKRLDKRNNELPAGTFEIPKEKMDEYMEIFQRPEREELL